MNAIIIWANELRTCAESHWPAEAPGLPAWGFQLRRHVRRYASSIASIDVGVRHLLVQCLAMQPILDEIDMIVFQLGRMFLIQHQQHGSLAHLRGSLVCRPELDGSTFSGAGASGKPAWFAAGPRRPQNPELEGTRTIYSNLP